MNIGNFHIDLANLAQVILALAALVAAARGRKRYEDWKKKEDPDAE